MPSNSDRGYPPGAKKGRTHNMETVGIMATVVVGAGVLISAVVLVRSIPDVAHYLRLRKM